MTRSASRTHGVRVGVALLVLVLALVGTGYYGNAIWHTIRAQVTDWQQWTESHLLLSLGLFVLVYAGSTALSIPISIWLSILAGALYGRWIGLAVVPLAATLGATLALLASRHLFRDWVRTRFGPRLVGLEQGFEQNGALYLLSLRMMPLVPFWLINLGFGLTPIRVRTFAAVSWVGMLPATFVYGNAGQELGAIESPWDVLTPQVLLALGLLAVLPWVLRMLFFQRFRPRS